MLPTGRKHQVGAAQGVLIGQVLGGGKWDDWGLVTNGSKDKLVIKGGDCSLSIRGTWGDSLLGGKIDQRGIVQRSILPAIIRKKWAKQLMPQKRDNLICDLSECLIQKFLSERTWRHRLGCQSKRPLKRVERFTTRGNDDSDFTGVGKAVSTSQQLNASERY